ncbi:hypothetical protein NX059_010818 [Plenodomus lindquistii]|nr:hypothetical protein NX059_010818 [Plenodomus lindquistii]
MSTPPGKKRNQLDMDSYHETASICGSFRRPTLAVDQVTGGQTIILDETLTKYEVKPCESHGAHRRRSTLARVARLRETGTAESNRGAAWATRTQAFARRE